ncbi:MAG: amylo-alpha-1,6-glucosidase [Candidatus Nanosalina sp.]
MKYSVTENLEDRSGIISNLHCFLNRNLDTGFKTKWSGLWSPPYKYMDYYAVKVNGIWLGEDTVQASEYGDKMIFHHEIDSLRVTETVEASPTAPGITVELEFENKLEEKKAVHTVLEPGIDIRHKSEDVNETEYEVEEGPNRLTASRDGKKLMISSNQDFKVSGEPYTKEHFPGERQKCLIPGNLSFKTELKDSEKIEIEFSTSDGVFGSLEQFEQGLEGEGLGRLFSYSIESLKNLIYDREGVGVIAGHPWFQSYWARDSFWSVLGLIDAGYFELSEDILTNFAEKGLPDKINIKRENRDSNPYNADTAPLFLIAADKLDRHFRINDKISKAIGEAKEELELNENGVVMHDSEGTWMDTLEREKAIDIQSLWLRAADIHDMDEKKDLEKGLEKYQESGNLKDNLGDEDVDTINPAVPLMYKQFGMESGRKYLEKMNAGFSSRYGARTRSMTDPGYESDGYHTGSSWGLTTGWMAAANLAYGKEKEGRNMLEKFNQFLDREQLGALPEVVDSEDGDLIGCTEQAWSAGLALHVIDSYLLGIKVKTPDKVVVDPAEDVNFVRTGKKIGDTEIDLKIRDGETEILNDPEIEIQTK